ncbi:MAG: carboxypeptidase regulatory-like domain-containing protein [Clostridiaceae bacterium]
MAVDRSYYISSSSSIALRAGELQEINIPLRKCTIQYNTIAAGKVLCGMTPLENALILVMDNSLNVLFKTYSDSNGIFLFKEIIPPGSYKTSAYVSGFIPSKIQPLIVEENKASKIYFDLLADTAVDKGIVYGTVFDTEGNPISDGRVYLSYRGRSIKSADGVTNEKGEYIIYNLLPGDFILQVEALGYEISEPINVKVLGNDRLPVDITLTAIGNNLGSITGVININGEAFGAVPVFLYQLQGKGFVLKEVQTSNSDGLFIFSNLPSGNYRVYSPLKGTENYNKSFILN